MHHRLIAEWSTVRRGLVLLGLACHLGTGATMPNSPSATALREQYTVLNGQLQNNAFQRPLILHSTETQQGLQGDIYALMSFPFDTVNNALKTPDQWCEVMILHINTKYCRASTSATGMILRIHLGAKTPQELNQAPQLRFNYKVTQSTPEYFEVLLDAKSGPLGTSDYRIRMEVVALPNSKSFLHLTYSYAVNFAGKLAMQSYLATRGANKVGFTVVNKPGDGQPVFIEGVRGLIERNTMRYYLAIDSLLQSEKLAPSVQFENRLQTWFSAVEQYPRQLHEMDRPTYLEMKRAEHIRQQTVQ
jgi:hypothetical protein